MTEEEFWAALTPLPPAPELFYRLYYDENGLPLFYSMEDLPGKYIEVSKEVYLAAPTSIRVVDGQLKITKHSTVLKLKPNGAGTPCHPTNVSIVVDESQPHTKWSLE